MSAILNKSLKIKKAELDEVLKDLHNMTAEIDAGELAAMVSELRNRINEPFMFVIVGEVKAGKSSFINALLSTGKEICKVAPQPMTDTVQQILYGEEEEEILVNPYLKKIMHPVDILKEIAIVDTPGTNTIVAHHQEITEKFIPASDLIVFVFEAKNPYRQSAWDFLDFIHQDWRKKVIFVLQQKDLMTETDLQVNEKGVIDNAIKKGINDPRVFSVSAKMEQEGLSAESGFGERRTFINQNIPGGKAPLLKMESNVNTAEKILERIGGGLALREKQLKADLKFREDIEETLSGQESNSKRQVSVLVENLVSGYDRITHSKLTELSDELSVFGLLKRSIASIFDKKASIKSWAEKFSTDLERDLHQELQTKLQNSVGDLAESIQQMAKLIDLKIQNSQTILKNDHEIFSQIAERRANVLKDLQDTFHRFLNRSENFTDKEMFPGTEVLSPNLLTGSGLAVVGTILMTVTNGMVFDITGGILTAVGVLFAGISTSLKTRQILTNFKSEIAAGRSQIESEVSEKLTKYVEMIREKLSNNFQSFDIHLNSEKKQMQALNETFQSIQSRLLDIKNGLG